MTESQEDTLMKAHLERIVKFISFKYLQWECIFIIYVIFYNTKNEEK
jgi:hypothetical protein